MSSKLSKESERRIIDGLDKVSTLMSDGMTPNDALIKIASDLKVPMGHIKLMVNAINTGTTNAHRLSTDDPLEKAAEFPLADLDVVLAELYPDEVKTKKAAYYESVVSKQYNQKPDFLQKQAEEEIRNRKLNWSLTDKAVNQEIDNSDQIKHAYSRIQQLQHDLNEKSRKVTEIRHKAASAIDSLRSYFSTPGNIPYKEVKENADILFGKQASAVLKPITHPKEIHTYLPYVPVNPNKAPYSIIKAAIDYANEFKNLSEDYLNTEKIAKEEAIKLILPFVKKSVTLGSVMDNRSLEAMVKDAIDKNSGLGTYLFGGALGAMNAGSIARDIARRLPISQTTSDYAQSDLKNLLDPSHESEIRNIQSEAMLNDLMANDDIIRGYDPEEVIDAYNEISQLTPYAADKKVIMRDLMRKRLSGGAQAMDQFTTGEALKQQENLRNMHSMPETSHKLLGSLGILNNEKSVISS